MISQREKASDSAQELNMEQNFSLFTKGTGQRSTAGSACTVPTQCTGLWVYLPEGSQGQRQMAPVRVQADGGWLRAGRTCWWSNSLRSHILPLWADRRSYKQRLPGIRTMFCLMLLFNYGAILRALQPTELSGEELCWVDHSFWEKWNHWQFSSADSNLICPSHSWFWVLQLRVFPGWNCLEGDHLVHI